MKIRAAKFIITCQSLQRFKIAAGATLNILALLSKIYDLMAQYGIEYGFRVGENGTVSRLVKGQTQEIDAQDWKPAVDDLKAAGDKVAYNVHGHPLYRDEHGKVVRAANPEPSDFDRVNAVGSQPNIVLGYKTLNASIPSGSLSSEISKIFEKEIHFYNKQNYPFKSFRFSTFERAVTIINNR